jgi:L-serine dehydratase
MRLSIFNLFNIGVGPSSSHTLGPMRAARYFIFKLEKHKMIDRVDRVTIDLCGSLSLTGKGHGTDRAILTGLSGENPKKVGPERVHQIYKSVIAGNKINLGAKREIDFDFGTDIIFQDKFLPFHPNGMIFQAFRQGQCIYRKIFYSVGGGFIVGHKSAMKDRLELHQAPPPQYQYSTGKELLDICARENLTIAQVALANEQVHRDDKRIDHKIDEIWKVMRTSIDNGLANDGTLPGAMQIKRRAKELHAKLKNRSEQSLRDPLSVLDWVNLYALAVNEENAAGGRVVTAPTNGAAGIIPSVINYYLTFCGKGGHEEIKEFLLTAGTIGLLYKLNASISGAEVGCQGEIGVACSMAAGGLCHLLGGTTSQVENAAEIGMEHNLGLTCDPVDGQVQIPCIERNAMGSVKAINAARIAMHGSGKHYVSLDQVMRTMKQTGADMKQQYKETAQGGLAVNITAC